MAVSGAWTYTESGGNATITDYDTGVGGFTPTIPTTLDTYPVIAIADGAMESKSLTSVTIGHVVDLVGDAIANNGALTVTINATITTSGVNIFASAFRNCTIAGNLTLDSGITSIPAYLFNASGLTSLSIPSSCTTIGDRAFNDNAISSLTLDHVLDLDDNSFANNGNIAVTISADITTNGVASVGTSPFENCTIGSGLTISEGVTNIDKYMFAFSGLTALTLPSTVVTIQDRAFTNNSIASLTLDHVLDLDDNAFASNGSMTLTISADITTNGVASFGTSPFESCTFGDTVTISSGVTTLDDYLLYGCGLTEIILPSTVVTINQYALGGNANLDNITIEAQETVAFGANVLTSCTPSPKGTIYGYDSSVETWASNWTTYYNYIMSTLASIFTKSNSLKIGLSL